MVEKPARKPSAKKKLVISLENVASAEVDAIVHQLEEAKKVPLVRNIGEPEKTGGSFRAIGWLVLSGAVGGLLTWLVWGSTETLFENEESTTVRNIFITMSVAVVVGIALAIGDTLQAGAASKLGKRIGLGLSAALVGGLVLGAIASYLYIAGVEAIVDDLIDSGLSFSDDEFFEEFSRRNQLNRGIAWSLIGLSAGVTVGLATVQWKRMLITGGGGLVGGFLGGFVFDLMPGQDSAQVLGLLITGLSIGAVIALSEEAAKTSWIEITHGGMAGKQFILYKSNISLGSSPSADITLIKDATMPGIAATLEKRGGAMLVASLDPQQPVFINGSEVGSAQLRDGDTLSIGKTGIRYRERGQKAVSSGVVRG
jgi:hypothetical protein